MDERTNLILSVFADWAADCQEEYKKRYEDPLILDEMERLKATVVQALSVHSETDFSDNYELYHKTKDIFMEAAYQYFKLRVWEGYDATGFVIWELEEQEQKWGEIISDTEKCQNLDELSATLSINNLSIPLLSKDTFTFKEIREDALRIIGVCKDQEHDNQYGRSAVFERLGMAYAERLISDHLPNKRGAPKKRNSPDTYRSFQFGKVVNRISEILQNAGQTPATAHEICHLLLGDKEQVSSFARHEDIRWAMKNYFRASTMTPNGFLNSISRGRRKPLV